MKYRTTTALKQLASEIYQINQANGWDVLSPDDWPDSHEKIRTKLMLIGTEIAEILEAYRKDDRENFEEECADTVIRILDLLGGLKFHAGFQVISVKEVAMDWEQPHQVGSRIFEWLCLVTDADNSLIHSKGCSFVFDLSHLLSVIFQTCDYLDMDLDAAIDKKLVKNKSRGYRHGGKKV